VATGKVVARAQASVAFARPGRIAAVLVREGDSVSKGQALAQLDTADLQTTADQQWAGYLKVLEVQKVLRSAIPLAPLELLAPLMNPLFKKLNYKNDAAIDVLNAPESMAAAIEEMRSVTVVRGRLGKGATFVLMFATKQIEVDRFAAQVSRAASGDVVIWIAYPKGSSKRYTCDFNRDTGWTKMGDAGFEPVRQVAIDEDWSALRFRRVEHIKTMTRTFAMTDAGKAKVKASKQKR
jgi:hypothetical protein